MDNFLKCIAKGGSSLHALEEAAKAVPGDEINEPAKKLKGQIPLLYAIQGQDHALATALLRNPAVKADVKDQEEVSALQLAVETAAGEMVDVLLKGTT